MSEFWNWARTYRCRPRLYLEPDSIESLRSILIDVNQRQLKVRVIGCGHSPSSLALSNDVLISMKHFNQIIDIDSINKQIHCQSGVLLSTLNEVLPQHNLALPVQGSVSTLTLAGVVSTATHGSGIEFGSFSSYVRSITLMKLTGEIIEYSLDNTDNELFRCLTCSLGTFGIIVSIRLQVSSLFYLELNQTPIKFDTFLNALSIHYTSSDHFRYMWYPHTNQGIAYHLTRIQPKQIKQNKSFFTRIYSWFRYSLIGHHVLEFLFYICLYIPRLVRFINRLYFEIDGQICHRIDRCDRLFNFDCLFYQYASEWAIPLDQTVSCLTELQQIIDENHHVHFPIEIRFSQDEDNSYLSPAYHRKTCWINTVSYRPYGRTHRKHQEFFELFERICYKYEGRPHWAKEHPLTSQQFQNLYPDWNLFESKRRQFDPNNLLLNDCLEKHFVL